MSAFHKDFFQVRSTLTYDGKTYDYYSLKKLDEMNGWNISRLPYSIKVLLEAAIRHFDGRSIVGKHVNSLVNWMKQSDPSQEVPFQPARVLLHDTTGVPNSCYKNGGMMQTIMGRLI